MADFRASAYLDIRDGGYPDEDRAPKEDTAWSQEYNAGDSGEHTETYYYADSNYLSSQWGGAFLNQNASRVYFEVTDKWTSKMLSGNRIEITCTTTLGRIWRGNITGNPNGGGNAHRRLTVEIGTVWNRQWPMLDIGVVETLLDQPVTFTDTFILEPESTYPTATIHVDNKTVEYNGPGDHDEIYIGCSFRNLLKKGFQHCVHYDANGGRDAPEDECWVDANECTLYRISTKEPWSPHWVFLGWSTNKNATTAQYRPGETITVCDEITLYAIYRYTYRPGMHMVNGIWKSCDRDGATGPVGAANIRRGGRWVEMRIDPIHTGLDDPPCIMQGGTWRIMNLIGDEGVPHHIKWDCPHVWN